MSNSEDIRKITTADLALEIANLQEYRALLSKKETDVYSRELKPTTGIAFAGNFASCQGVSFFHDEIINISALAHNHSEHDPSDFLTGKYENDTRNIGDPLEIFNNSPEGITAIHTYNEDRHNFGPGVIEGALASIGIKRVIHIPLIFRDHRGIWRSILQDTKKRSVFIYPLDDIGNVAQGIKFNLTNQ